MSRAPKPSPATAATCQPLFPSPGDSSSLLKKAMKPSYKTKTEARYFTHIGKPITPAMVVCPVLYTGKYLDTSHESKMEKKLLVAGEL